MGNEIIRRDGFCPETMEQALKFAEYISESSLVPTSFRGKPADILVAIQHGREIGLSPMQALASIAVINGRASIFGDASLALVRAATGVCDFVSESFEGTGESLVAVCVCKRRDQEAVVTSRFGVADAKKAGLWTKGGPWSSYPLRMLQMRARGFALRDAFPDVLRGLVLTEEAEDYGPLPGAVETTARVVPPPPSRKTVQIRPVPPESAPEAPGEAAKPPAVAPGSVQTPPPAAPQPPAEAPPPADSGKASKGTVISEAQRKRMWAIGHAQGWTTEQAKELLKLYGYESSNDVLRGQDYDDICAAFGKQPEGKQSPAEKF